MATTTKVLRANVERGCALLDLYYVDALDQAWETDIDLGILDISDGGRCVLAQRFGSFTRGKIALSFHWNASFNDLCSYGFSAIPQDLPQLNALWKAAITDRRQRNNAV